MKQADINHLIMQDLDFKMKAWRTIAIITLMLFFGMTGLFIGSEIELKNTKTKLEATINGSQNYYCKKGD
ncbi:MAG: hypothetical protein Q4A23_00070 [bacterium]|nr:hypothetical protein [bacterium]